MTGNNGHSPGVSQKRAARILRVQGALGALPRQAEGSFRGGENSPKMQKRDLFAPLADLRLLRL